MSTAGKKKLSKVEMYVHHIRLFFKKNNILECLSNARQLSYVLHEYFDEFNI